MLTVALVAATCLIQDAPLQAPRRASRPPAAAATAPLEPTLVPGPEEAMAAGVQALLAMQETLEPPIVTDGHAEWPYEGVYRVRGAIPLGYRVGGTSICAMALLAAPGYHDDPARHEAIARACRFVCDATRDPLLSPDYQGGYDVRGWGHCYAIQFLAQLKADGAVPAGQEAIVDERLRWYVDALQRIEIPQVGGWSYSRGPVDQPSPCSPFMTAPALQALFLARAEGVEVDAAVVERGLEALERCRTASGAFAYAAQRDAAGSKDGTPGATGRMLAGETTLLLAGRGSAERVRGALDAFIAHWDRLEERRAQQGTHVRPFGVAPYYFYFAHFHAAQAIEALPAHERPEYRRKLLELLWRTRDAEGRWNDRVFPRSANYGTAMALLAIAMPEWSAARRWEGVREAAE